MANPEPTTLAGLALSGGSAASIGDPAKLGILTISDRASTGVYEDLSGPAILQFFHDAIDSPWQAVYRLIPDEQPIIEQAIIDLVGAETFSCFTDGQRNWLQLLRAVTSWHSPGFQNSSSWRALAFELACSCTHCACEMTLTG